MYQESIDSCASQYKLKLSFFNLQSYDYWGIEVERCYFEASHEKNTRHASGKDGLTDDLTETVVNNTILEKVQHLKYLGSVKSSDGTCLKDVMARIAMAKAKMIQLKNIWKDRSIAINLKLAMLKSLIVPVLMYGCGASSVRKKEEDELKAAEVWLNTQS